MRKNLRLIRRHWWIVLLTLVAGVGIAMAVTVRTPPRYQASVTFFVTTPTPGVTDAYRGNLFLQQRVKSYADLLGSDRLAQSVVAENPLGLTAGQLQRRISTSTEEGSVLLKAEITDTDRTRALKLTRTLATRFVDLVQKVETPPDGKPAPIKLEVVSGPRVSSTPVSPRPERNLPLGGLIGLLVGAALALLRGAADVRMRDAAALQRVTGSPLLGEIPFESDAKSAPLIVGEAANSARAEAVRKLRTNLRFVDVHEPARVIAVTSALQGEGKTTLACNTAIALAEAGWRVLLIDADLRRPKIADYLGLDGGVGLTDVLVGDVEVGDVVQRWGDKSLLVLPSGAAPPNPSELLGSKAMADLLLALRESADIVVVDTAPLLAVTDGVVVAVQADGALLVAQQGRISRGQVAAAAGSLHSVSVRILGCVLNMARVGKADKHHYAAYRVVTPPAAPSVPGERAAAPRPKRAGAGKRVNDRTQELSRQVR